MRLMKRLAICILAAAMAMSMLTACGDDAPSAPADSTPSASQEEEKKDDPPKEEEKDNENKDDGNTEEPDDSNIMENGSTTWALSKTRKYFEKVTSTNYYANGYILQKDGIEIGTPNEIAKDAQGVTVAFLGNKKEGVLNARDNTVLMEYYQNEAGKLYKYYDNNWIQVLAEDEQEQAKNYLTIAEAVFSVPELSSTTEIKKYKAEFNGKMFDYELVPFAVNGVVTVHTYVYDSMGNMVHFSTLMKINGEYKSYLVWPGVISKCDPAYFPQL